MRGVVASYPKIDKANGKLLNLDARINQCRSERMGAEPLRYESEELLALTAYIARQSLRLPIKTSIEGAARAHFEAGGAPPPLSARATKHTSLPSAARRHGRQVV